MAALKLLHGENGFDKEELRHDFQETAISYATRQDILGNI